MASGKKYNLVGQRFGKLLVIEKAPVQERNGHRIAYWVCRCDCGNITTTQTYCLHRKKFATVSCGCHKRELVIQRNFRHGLSGTSEYNIWCTMKERCFNPNNVDYPEWGGRGITVCDRWKNSFENFLADMGPRDKGKSLDRKNNDGDYEPDNCRWATAVQQANNRRPRSKSK